MQQCRFVYTITRADCRACNGLDAGCRNYEPNPEPKAWRETDAGSGTRWINFERGNVEDGYGNGDRGIGAGCMRGMVLRTGRRMARSSKGGRAQVGGLQGLGVASGGQGTESGGF